MAASTHSDLTASDAEHSSKTQTTDRTDNGPPSPSKRADAPAPVPAALTVRTSATRLQTGIRTATGTCTGTPSPGQRARPGLSRTHSSRIHTPSSRRCWDQPGADNEYEDDYYSSANGADHTSEGARWLFQAGLAIAAEMRASRGIAGTGTGNGTGAVGGARPELEAEVEQIALELARNSSESIATLRHHPQHRHHQHQLLLGRSTPSSIAATPRGSVLNVRRMHGLQPASRTHSRTHSFSPHRSNSSPRLAGRSRRRWPPSPPLPPAELRHILPQFTNLSVADLRDLRELETGSRGERSPAKSTGGTTPVAGWPAVRADPDAEIERLARRQRQSLVGVLMDWFGGGALAEGWQEEDDEEGNDEEREFAGSVDVDVGGADGSARVPAELLEGYSRAIAAAASEASTLAAPTTECPAPEDGRSLARSLRLGFPSDVAEPVGAGPFKDAAWLLSLGGRVLL